MRRHLAAVAWLLCVWLALWRDVSIANVLSGVLLAVVVLALFPLPPPRSRLRVRLVPLLEFLAIFTWSVIKANLIVAWEVITPRNRINEGVVAVPMTTRDPIVITAVSHAIILSPGTMVIDIDRLPATVLFVHALHLRSEESLRHEVHRLERLAVAAFGRTEVPTAAPTRGGAT